MYQTNAAEKSDMKINSIEMANLKNRLDTWALIMSSYTRYRVFVPFESEFFALNYIKRKVKVNNEMYTLVDLNIRR